MSPKTAPVASTATFTPGEWQALRTLRARYWDDRDLFDARELTHLRFLRWLHQTVGGRGRHGLRRERFHEGMVLMAAELELAAGDAGGVKLSTTFVEPP